jgi:hypothetical protein
MLVDGEGGPSLSRAMLPSNIDKRGLLWGELDKVDSANSEMRLEARDHRTEDSVSDSFVIGLLGE